MKPLQTLQTVTFITAVSEIYKSTWEGKGVEKKSGNLPQAVIWLQEQEQGAGNETGVIIVTLLLKPLLDH